jgi:L-ascorbate metabolism protein UlaG (beta-lactamase superfamily)
MGTSLLFRWLGVAGIELGAGGQVLAIDPFFTRPSFLRIWLGRVEPNHKLIAEKLKACDHVLVTHAHWDHLMDVPDVAANTGAAVFGSANTCRLLSLCGVRQDCIRQLAPGARIELAQFSAWAFPAEHIRLPGFLPGPLPSGLRPPLRLRDYRMDGCFSFLVDAGSLRLLDWRSIHPEPAPRAHILLVSPWESPAFFGTLLGAVRPRVVIPVHWDDFLRPLSKPVRPLLKPPRWGFPPLRRNDLGEFARTIEALAPEVKVLVPEIFRVYDLCELTRPGAQA